MTETATERTGWDTEINRVAALRALCLLDTPREERFDRITRMAKNLLDVPIAMVSLVDLDRLWLKSCLGADDQEIPRGESFCSYAVAQDELMEVEDARVDPRFAHYPSVVDAPYLRFYAGQPIHASSGHRIGTLCVVDRSPRRLSEQERAHLRDLAAWVELECTVIRSNRAVLEAERTRQDFVAVVDHALRTPLTSVLASLEVLTSGSSGELGEQATRLLRIACEDTDRLRRLAEDVLDLSKVRGNRLRLRLAAVDLADVVRAAVAAVPAGDVTVLTHTMPCPVRADADRLVQVVTNVLANAVCVSAPGQRVDVTCRVDGEAATVEVADDGPGVTPEEVDRIFEPFVRSGGPGGAGLGLAIAKGIVDAHAGSITVDSTPGRGSTFVLTLPSAGPQADRSWW